MPALIKVLSRWTARIVAAAFLATAVAARAEAPTLRWQVVAEYPRDAAGFTQGLVWHEGRLFESDGQYGDSQVAEKVLATGKTLKATAIPANEFGEGLALLRGNLWQLTWREGVLHRYDLALNPAGVLRYRGEGWGLTSDGRALIVSDGSDTLIWLDPDGPNVVRSVTVKDGDEPIRRLNELEWIEGAVYANVWMTDRIARIDPASGAVTGWLDLAALKKKAGISAQREAEGAVLNGIAWRADNKHLLVTGKWWPTIYEIKLLPAR